MKTILASVLSVFVLSAVVCAAEVPAANVEVAAAVPAVAANALPVTITVEPAEVAATVLSKVSRTGDIEGNTVTVKASNAPANVRALAAFEGITKIVVARHYASYRPAASVDAALTGVGYVIDVKDMGKDDTGYKMVVLTASR